MLSKEASHKKPYILWVYLYEMSKRGKSIETKKKKKIIGSLGLGGGGQVTGKR